MSTTATIFISANSAPNRRHFAVLALLFAAVAIYGSLAPLRFHPLPLAQAVECFRLVLAHPIAVQSRSDWLANSLLQLPFGFCLMAAICCDRPLFFAAPALLVTLIACLALAGFVEFAQLYFPPRVCSINDIVAQELGGATGAFLWLIRGQRLTANARRLWSDFGSRSTAHLLLPLYLFFLLVIQALPFDFTLSPVEIYHKYKIGRIHLSPFADSGVGSFELANKHFWNIALFAPVGLLLAHLPGLVGRNAAIVFVLGFTIAVAIEFIQLLAWSRYYDTTDILTGTASVFVGWFAARRYAGLLDKPGLRAVLLACCVAVLIFMEWQPFDFVLSLSRASQRFHAISLVPFAEYLQGQNYLNALDDCVHKILLFGTLGAALTPHSSASRATFLFRWSLAIALAAVLEAGQVFLPSRHASVTDVLIASASSGFGMFVVHRFEEHPRPLWKPL
jgi:VanZ family protein